MKRGLAILSLVIALPLLTFGLLFLIAAMAKPERLLVAAALLAIGTVAAAWGALTLRHQAQTAPEALATGAIALARRLGGEVTVAQMQAEYRIPAERAQATLDALCARGEARAEQREGRVVYVVSGLQAAVVMRRCPHCGSTFPVREALYKCPNCGGELQVEKT